MLLIATEKGRFRPIFIFTLAMMLLSPLLQKKSRFQSSGRKGIALLITLVILALLAVFMVEFAFETTLETRGIQNFQASFKARNAVKSMFKAVLVGLEEQEEVVFFKRYLKGLLELGALGGEISYLNPPEPIRLPEGLMSDFPDVAFFTPYIRPIDHLFNLNKISRNDPNTPLETENRNIFHNIFISLNNEMEFGDSTYISFDEEQILKLYGSIYDWIDTDQEPYPEYGQEYYQQFSTDFNVKNGQLDQLQEITLLGQRSNNNLVLDNLLLNKYFTIHKVGTIKSAGHSRYMNINLANESEIKAYLKQFENLSKINEPIQDYISKASDIAYVISIAERKKGLKSFKDDTEIQTTLNSHPQTSSLRVFAKKFFIPYSYWYEIRLKTEIENVQAELRAVVSLDRNTDGTVQPDSMKIHDFVLR